MRVNRHDARIGLGRCRNVLSSLGHHAAVLVDAEVQRPEFQYVGLRRAELERHQANLDCAVLGFVHKHSAGSA